MSDREKVIKGIRKCLSHKPCSENDCPYENECAVEHLNDPLLRDALTLLKQQEPVKVEKRKEEAEWNVCSNCGGHLVHKWSYCPYCGKAVKWNE